MEEMLQQKEKLKRLKKEKRAWVNQKHKGNKEILIDCTVVEAMRFQSNEGLYFQRKSKQETRNRKYELTTKGNNDQKRKVEHKLDMCSRI